MVMVVAMLSMLFVVGTAFLATVSFEGSAIEGAKRQKTQDRVVDTISREIRQALKDSMLGSDGLPFNQDTASAIGIDSYGEIPGVHPLIASFEPYDPDGFDMGTENAQFFATSDLKATLGDSAIDTSFEIDVPLATVNPDEMSEGDSSAAIFRRDADGDGVWDSYTYKLSETRYPKSVRGDLAERLRDPDFVAGPGQSDDDLYYSIRVVPHGAMVNLNYAHNTLLGAVFSEMVVPDNISLSSDPYAPESEEPVLRNRFMLPPRELPLSSLQSRPIDTLDVGDIAEALYARFLDGGVSDTFLTGGMDGSNPRWWLYNTADADSPSGEVRDDWLKKFDASNYGAGTPADLEYDFRHVLTTVSYDDQLMRMPTDPMAQQDRLQQLIANGHAVEFSIDDYPENRANQAAPLPPLNGRLKVSLPYLQNVVLKSAGSTFFTDDNSGEYDDDPLGVLSDTGLPQEIRDRFIRTIQDGFLMMLHSVDNNGAVLGSEKGRIAATLTANLIDFADSDDVPTRVELRNPLSGIGGGPVVYGLERQPFITELYYQHADPPICSIELFNPYEESIDLSDFKLIDLRADNTGYGVIDLNLSGSIAGRTFSEIDSASAPEGDEWALSENSVVQLIRNVPNVDIAGSTDVVCDVFAVSHAETSSPNFGSTNDGEENSLQRMTGPVTSPDDNVWTCVVPRAREFSGPGTLGAANTNAFIADLLPVEIQFANTGDLTTAFPTTGMLLLLSQFANDTGTPFNSNLLSGFNVIDNGRMPVFDQTKLAAIPDNPTTLSIPWGQLVFDYFTALPLQHSRADEVEVDMTPKIDMNGLRVHGRVDINSAPWTVLSGLPYVPMIDIPLAFRPKISQSIYGGSPPQPDVSGSLGPFIARSIVAYRESRQIVDPSGDASPDFETEQRLRYDATNLPTGFLTVGELANVRVNDDPMATGNSGTGDFWSIDSGVIDGSANFTGYNGPDYVQAVAVLVALGDWVTTRSDVFTVYGTLRGAGQKEAVDQRAIRFQETVDRLPSVLNPRKLPKFIGRRVVGSYAQVGDE